MHKLAIFLLFSFNLVVAQDSIEPKLKLELTNLKEILSNSQDANTYQVTLGVLENKKLTANFNLRVEDELSSEETYILINDIAFFDLSFNYKFNKFNLNFQFDNVLGYASNEFDIEPNLVNSNVFFSHEANFLFSTSIVYKF